MPGWDFIFRCYRVLVPGRLIYIVAIVPLALELGVFAVSNIPIDLKIGGSLTVWYISTGLLILSTVIARIALPKDVVDLFHRSEPAHQIHKFVKMEIDNYNNEQDEIDKINIEMSKQFKRDIIAKLSPAISLEKAEAIAGKLDELCRVQLTPTPFSDTTSTILQDSNYETLLHSNLFARTLCTFLMAFAIALLIFDALRNIFLFFL